MPETRRKKLSLFANPQREPELIEAEIKQLESIVAKSKDKPGLHQRVAEAEARLMLCREELNRG
jgi:hypothetical protein